MPRRSRLLRAASFSKEEHLVRLLESWPPNLASDLVDYLSAGREQSEDVRRGLSEKGPYWVWLPSLLLASRAGSEFTSESARAEFLEDVLWGQHCLFLYVRIQDDIFDRQLERLNLLYAAVLLLMESERAFSKHFEGDSTFWSSYRSCVQETTLAIVEVNDLQSTPGARGLLDAYARVSAIFKVGSIAVCLKLGRDSPLDAVCAVMDQLAMAGQIVDDLMDIEEDFGQDKWNFAASLIWENRERSKRKSSDPLISIAESFWYGDGAALVLGEARKRLAAAGAVIDRLKLRGARAYVTEVQQSLEACEDNLHYARVESFFAGLHDE